MLTQRNIMNRRKKIYLWVHIRHCFFLYQVERASHLEIVRGILDTVIENVLQQFSKSDVLHRRLVGTEVAQPRYSEIIDLASDSDEEEDGGDEGNEKIVKSILDALLDDVAQIQANKVKCGLFMFFQG